MANEVVTAVGLGAAVTVPVILALGKFAGLRDAMYTKWAARVDLATAGLSERAVNLLRRLQKETDAQLGSGGAPFDPDAALADPAPLARTAANFQRTIEVRRLLPRRFRRLLGLAIAAPIIAITYVVGVWLVVVHYADFLDMRVFPETGFGIAALAGVAALAAVLGFFYLEWRLTSADIMSQKANSAAKKRTKGA